MKLLLMKRYKMLHLTGKPIVHRLSSVFKYCGKTHYTAKKCNVRLPLYVKHALNVRYKMYVKRMDRAPYI